MVDPQRRPDAGRVGLAFVVCTVIWGSTFLFIRIGNDTMPPMWAGALRLALAAAILIPIAWFGGGLPRGPALRAAAVYGFFQFGINLPLLYWGETVVSSGLAAVVYATVPITGALIATAFGLERLKPGKLGGAGVALAGVAVLFAHDLSARVTALPLLAIFGATVSAALGTVMLKRGPRQSATGASAIGALVGVPVCLLASFLMREPHPWPLRWVQLYPILFLAVMGSVVAFTTMAWLVHRVDVSSIGFIGVVVPLIAVALGALVRHERLSREHLIGSVLVIAGVVIAIASDRRASRRTPAGSGSRAP